jgi:4,5-DOPA dioxygenase extradiol
MYPQAHIPVVQLSVQSDAPAEYHYRLGLALAPLRENGILILASGGATHDLSAMADFQRTDPAVDYAEEFDRWLEATISTGNTDALLTYRQSAPAAERNHPYPAEHFLPLLVAAGAGAAAPRGRRLHRHFEYGVLSLAAYRWD